MDAYSIMDLFGGRPKYTIAHPKSECQPIVQLTIYTFLYEWISLFSKSIVHLIFSILANLSDFGFIQVLFMLCISVVKDFCSFAVSLFTFFSSIVSGNENEDNEEEVKILKSILNIKELTIESLNESIISGFFVYSPMRIIFKANHLEFSFLEANLLYLMVLTVLIGVMIFCLTKKLYLAWISIIFEIILLLLIFLYFDLIYQFIKYRLKRRNVEKTPSDIENVQEIENAQKNQKDKMEETQHSQNETLDSINEEDNYSDESNISNIEEDNNSDPLNNDTNSKENSDISLSSEDSTKVDISSKILTMLKISSYQGLLSSSRLKNEPISIIFFILANALIILALQLYSIIYPFIQKKFGAGNFVLYLFVKLVFFKKNLCFNFIDSIIFFKRMLKTFDETLSKVIYVVVLLLHFLFLVSFIVFYLLFGKYVFPTIDDALYTENNIYWIKNSYNQRLPSESFCYAQSKIDGSLKTEDFAMLTTLPRLYNINKDGKCYIKPSMRGLFNTTMKYIFGKNYENDGIEIFCKDLDNYITLIVRSDKILNLTLNSFADKGKIKLLDKQFKIDNIDYFKEHPIGELPDEGKNLLKIYEQCSSQKGSENCEKEWDIFTQYYWTNMYSKDYVDIPGFEKYQITLNSSTIIQPSFIDPNGQPNAGTHYIIGGSYENKIGIGLYIEALGKKYVPLFFQNIIFFYSLISNLLREVFIKFDWFNSKLVYIDFTSQKDMSKLTELYAQFNFSHNSLFTIGHSISATEMKGVSSISNIPGIVFEATEVDNLNNFKVNPSFQKNDRGKYQIINVYSEGNFFTGNDEKCIVNGKLPKRYYFPNVYDTACLTIISCSETMRYIPFCHQVLKKTVNESIEEFNKSFKAYNNQYGY
ncbi:hypothetical protein M9Y10_010542 [Tritrichomonas musculus]|uniref:Uncharacterized protein n=1 Tax=Tritrichomonas musculus TaxID=1915356 RepID=A0ABR2IM93_9EUKA